ncbi:MAG: tRNA 2-thiouridine(34) synthase MnmA [Desulfobacterales bacterium]|nr:tRNA 2-thiouridine(34) synthase MnmA [Desulfobacterales bacterium]
MSSPVAIAVSGGIDSMTAAWLLKAQGRSPMGIHFTTGYESAKGFGGNTGEAIGRRLGIPVTTVDIAGPFRARVVDYFADTYARGQTPNPCMVCNQRIKFDLILETALGMGASHLATGHYARCATGTRGHFRLSRGIDPEKDQSYFLARLDQRALSRAMFPLGAMTKVQVRALAANQGLSPVFSGESQDVCFIPRGGYGAFLHSRAGFTANPGPIVDTNGNVLGRHRGLPFYTVGQRRGLDCPASQPYYVVRLELEKNRLVIGFKKEIMSSGCRVSHVRWTDREIDAPTDVAVQIRYRGPASAALLTPTGNGRATVRFHSPLEAVTPGQAAVFYRGDEVLGSGWIKEALPADQ